MAGWICRTEVPPEGNCAVPSGREIGAGNPMPWAESLAVLVCEMKGLLNISQVGSSHLSS